MDDGRYQRKDMDRSGDRVLNDDALHEALRHRTGSRWVFLAAAAGKREAIEELCTALSRAELDRGTAGAALTPSLVSERVEALAASGGNTLVRVARDWRRPSEIGDDPFWSAAWTSALRHVAAPLALDANDFRASAVAMEAQLLWPTGDVVTHTWDALAATCRARLVPYEEIRRWSSCNLADRHFQEQQVRDAPTLLLRVLRGRFDLLTAGAVHTLRERSDDLLDQDPFEAALLAEVLTTFDDSWLATFRRRLVQRLPTVHDAQEIIPLAYLLLGHGWVVP
jgi:hypothetical protein